MQEDDEFIQPLDLSVQKSSVDHSKRKKRFVVLLGFLLSIWSYGVYLFFIDEPDQDTVIRAVSTSQPAVATDVPEIQSTAEPVDQGTPNEVFLIVETDPAGATVSRDGTFEGLSPLKISDPKPGQALTIRKTGYESETHTLSRENPGRDLQFSLKPILGKIRFNIRPVTSRIQIDGQVRILPSDGLVELSLGSHEVEISAAGYVTQILRITPAQAYERTVSVELEPVAEPTPVSVSVEPQVTGETVKENSQGLEMIRPELPMLAQLGSPRGTSGRQSNEVEIKVELKRNFRISKTEISNAQFRNFNPGHQSGRWKGIDLNGAAMPVVNITWEDAVAYCNWLSKQEGLSPAYIENAGKWEFSEKPGTGYRLPTEAEWEAIARLEVQQALFGWGEEMPPPQGLLNVAGRESKKHFGVVVENYQDLFSGPAPVDKAGEGPLGLRGLYGNVKEWVHDGYGIPPISSRVLSDPIPSPARNFHVIKGASWQDAGVVDLRISRRRYGSNPATDLGFRVARYLNPTP